MTDPRPRPGAPRHRLGTVALLTAFAFGCTTIRAPVALMGSPITIHDGAATPQLELWLESAKPISPEEAARVSGEARAALEAALAGREVGDDSTVLVVRAQGVTRSASHKSDQAGAVVALALTAVVVVIGLVLWLSAGGKGGKGGGDAASAAASVPRGVAHGGPHAGPRPPPPVSPAVPVAGAARPVPAPTTSRPSPVAARPPPTAARPPPYHHAGGSSGATVDVGLDLGPFPVETPPGEPVLVSSRELPPPPDALDAPPGPADGSAETAGLVILPALPPLPVEERSFFDGDSIVLELTLVDRLTGEPRWTKWVEEAADPLDPAAVRQVLDRALGEPAGWQPAR